MDRNKLIIPALLITSLCVYIGVVFGFDYWAHHHELLYKSIDPKGYKMVADWIFNKHDTVPYQYILIRPFLYPLVIGAMEHLFNDTAVWFLQFLLWLASVYLLSKCLLRTGVKPAWVIPGVALFALNVTGVLLTLHGFTETLTTFLLCVYSYTVFLKFEHRDNKYWLIIISIAALLTVTKPLFQFLLAFSFLFMINDFLRQRQFPRIGYLLLLFIAISPVFIQLGIMKKTFNAYTISKIGSQTFREYYVRKVYGEVYNLKTEDVWKKDHGLSHDEQIKLLMDHPGAAIGAYLKNIHKGNMMAGTNLAHWPGRNELLSNFSKNLNKACFWIHLIFLILGIRALVLFTKHRQRNERELLLLLFIPVYLIILTSGITYWQGDRVIYTALPVWIALYMAIMQMHREIPILALRKKAAR